MGAVLLDRGKVDEAIPLISEAEQLAGPTPEGLRTLAEIQQIQGDDDAAQQSLKRG